MSDIPKTRAKRQPDPRAAVWILLFAVVVALGWVALGLRSTIGEVAPLFAGPEGAAAAYGVIFGHSLFIAVIVWAVTYFAALRRWAPGRGLLAFGLLLGVTLVANIVAVNLLKASAEREVRNTVAAVHEIGGTFRQAVRAPDTAVVDTRAKAPGGAGELETAAKSYAAAVLRDRRDYRAELQAAGFPAALTPAALAKDPQQTHALAMLARCRDLVAKYRARTEARIGETRAAVERTRALPEAKRAFLQGFDEAAVRQEPVRARMWDLEDGIIGEYQAAVQVLHRPSGEWRVEGQRFMFASPADLSAWQAHMAGAKRLSAEEMSAIQAQTAAAEKQLDAAEAQMGARK